MAGKHRLQIQRSQAEAKIALYDTSVTAAQSVGHISRFRNTKITLYTYFLRSLLSQIRT